MTDEQRDTGETTGYLRSVAAAARSLVRGDDPVSTATAMLLDCRRLLDAGEAGIVLDGDHGLELLAATSHVAQDIELFQLEADSGPCVEALRGSSDGDHDLTAVRELWPVLAELMREAGLGRVRTVRMRWHGNTFGAFNVFFHDDVPLSEAHIALVDAYADVAALAVVHADEDLTGQLQRRLLTSLEHRSSVETAKGVLSVQHEVDPDAAYDVLVRLAEERHQPLARVAADVVRAAARPSA